MTTQIPSSRADFLDPRSGNISREWFMFFGLMAEKVEIWSTFMDGSRIANGDISVDGSLHHLAVSVTATITLEPYLLRKSVLSVVNIGTGIVTILPRAGELINGGGSKILSAQWESVQLCPMAGGYVII